MLKDVLRGHLLPRVAKLIFRGPSVTLADPGAHRGKQGSAGILISIVFSTLTEPKWKDTDTVNYTELCTIIANLSHLPLKPFKGYQGRTYYRVDYHVVLLFGLTELKAQISWKEDGVENRSPAKIVYDN
ncbi:hypothetical protein BDZ97DRAFT_1923071 [Flammula alnicola]|nr:hypothetical protein BDZ97DRAFT_1923071 [Flammula alnicola]